MHTISAKTVAKLILIFITRKDAVGCVEHFVSPAVTMIFCTVA